MKRQEPQTPKKPQTSKLMSRTELKSTIPKPLPYLRSRVDTVTVRAKSVSSCRSQPVRSSRIPLVVSADRGKTSFSLKSQPPPSRPGTIPEVHSHNCNKPAASARPLLRPKSASVAKNPYQNVKARVDSKPCDFTKTKKDVNAPMASMNSDPMQSVDEVVSEEDSCSVLSEDIKNKQRQILTIYQELKRTRPAKDIQPLEMEIFRMMQINTSYLNSDKLLAPKEDHVYYSESAPQFLTTFERQMQEVTRLWLQFVCDLGTAKLTMSSSAIARITIPDPTLNLYEEVIKFLTSLAVEGEPLHKKIEAIEKEQQKVMTMVVHNVLDLAQQFDILKDSHSRLEKTQDNISDELNEKIAFLEQENQEITSKFDKVVDKYNSERVKVEQQEKYKLTINTHLTEAKKVTKCFEGKCQEWENKLKKMETTCRALEVSVRNRDLTCDKETKQHRDALTKLNSSKQTIEKLKADLAENSRMRMCLEMDVEKLKKELNSTKATCEELKQKRNELMEELGVKNKKLLDSENESSLIQAYISDRSTDPQKPGELSKVMMEDVSKDLHQRNLEIHQLKKELNTMEHVLKEKTTREEILLNQITDLQTKPRENEIALKTQIEELEYAMKELTADKVALERMVAQKSLELDQRDLLTAQQLRVQQTRDQLIPTFQDKLLSDQERIERLSTVIFHQRTTYLDKGDDAFNNTRGSYLPISDSEKSAYLDPVKVDRELAFRQGKMSELYSLLEQKQMDIMRLERRLRELEGTQDLRDLSQRDKEARMAALHDELSSHNKAAKSWGTGFFSLFSGHDGTDRQ